MYSKRLTMDQTNLSTTTLLHKALKALERNQQQFEALTTKLLAATAEITELRKEVESLKKKPTPPTLGTSASKHATVAVEKGATTTPHTYAERARKAISVTPPTRKTMPIERASRLFTKPSTTAGYRFVYLAQKGRVPMNEIRRSLSALGVNNARIMDIHFPDRNVCGLLIHNDFEQELINTLQHHKVQLLPTFDPHAPEIIRNPSHRDDSIADKTALAKSIQRTRIHRIIYRATARVRPSLLASFIAQAATTYGDYQSFITQLKQTDATNPNFPDHRSKASTHFHFTSDTEEVTDEEHDPMQGINEATNNQ